MPCLGIKLGILAVRDGAPSSFEDAVNDRRGESRVNHPLRDAVNSSTKHLIGNDDLPDVARCNVDADRLCRTIVDRGRNDHSNETTFPSHSSPSPTNPCPNY